MTRKTILLVDDDVPIRTAIRDFLTREYNVLEVSNYAEAIKHIDSQIDLAVIDYALPDKDGFEVLKSIRNKKPDIPAIMITAFSTEDVAIEAIKARITDYMRKPFALEYLHKRVSELLEGKYDYTHTELVQSRKKFKMDSIALYIEKKYREEGLTINQMASMANMDRTSFCRAFRAKFGQSFISYLNNIRIKNAIDLLKKDLTIKEIALFVGYRSVEYFNRVFKKIHGISPSDYRKKIQEKGKIIQL